MGFWSFDLLKLVWDFEEDNVFKEDKEAVDVDFIDSKKTMSCVVWSVGRG